MKIKQKLSVLLN